MLPIGAARGGSEKVYTSRGVASPAGLYDAKSLVTSTYPLEKTMDAYQAVADRTTVTAMITFT
jgi:hypothetical protein